LQGGEQQVDRIASLPMYDIAEAQRATDALWDALRQAFARAGLGDAPSRLTRDLPVISQWGAPNLFFSQCCGYDVVCGFSSALEILGVPRYADETGCSELGYRSYVIVHAESRVATLADLRGATCAVNGFNSYSGTGSLRALVAPLSHDGRFFREIRVSGAHVRSIEMVRAGTAEVAAIDCVTYSLLRRYRPQFLAGTRILMPTDPVPPPPYVTSRDYPPEAVARMQAALVSVLDHRPRHGFCDDLFIAGVSLAPLQVYSKILAQDEIALGRGYYEMHPTSTALIPN
jgi:ABC-type phosphate/phosphonate transport system substrate-binding protein